MNEKEWIDFLNNYFRANWGNDVKRKELSELTIWDSFEILSFMTDVYDRYGIKITPEEIYQIRTLEELLIFLHEKQME